MENNNDIELKEFLDNTDLNNYNKELLEDTKLTKVNLREKSLMVSGLRVKWLNRLFKERDNLQRIKKAKDKILRSKLGQNTISNSVLKMKSEDSIAGNDEQIKKLNALSETVKTNIDFLERAQNILNDFGFNIKNAVDIFKLEKM